MQQPNKKIIDYLSELSEYELKNINWYDVGERFGVTPPDEYRSIEDPSYKREAIRKKTKRIWEGYVKSRNELKPFKEVYDKDGNILFETFKKEWGNSIDKDIDYDEYELHSFTTNPNGPSWLKFSKKEKIFNTEHLDDIKKILDDSNIKTINYDFNESTSEKSLLIYGADKHIGALTKENSIYNNKYDENEMRKRIVEYTIKEILESVNIHGKFENLFIMDLGDALDGFNSKTTRGIFGESSHTLPQQYNNREQHDLYLKLHAELFKNIIEVFKPAKNIYFISCSNSNHGGDFEYTAMKHFQTYLNLKYPDVKTAVSHKPFDHFIFDSHCVIFGHGKDDEDMKSNLPLTLNEKVKNYINNYIETNKLNEYYITFVSGDLHQSAETYGHNFRYLKVLSQFGSSKWAHTNFGSGMPGLTSEIFLNKENKIFKSNTFFNIENESNTGLAFN